MIKIIPLIVFLFSGILLSCNEAEPVPGNCDYTATVIDLSGVDGCGFVLETADGTRYEPIFILMCGNGAEYQESPVVHLDLKHGQTVSFSYESWEGGTICMAGTPVRITCMVEIAPPPKSMD